MVTTTMMTTTMVMTVTVTTTMTMTMAMTEAIFTSSWASARTVRSVQQGSEAQEPCAVGHPPSARRGAEAGATAGRRRRPVAMFVQAHAFALAEGDGQRPLCMVPRAQRPLSQVFKMPRSLVLQPGLSAVPLGSRTSRGVLGHPVRACLRPTSEGIADEAPGYAVGLQRERKMPNSWFRQGF